MKRAKTGLFVNILLTVNVILTDGIRMFLSEYPYQKMEINSK